MEIKLHEITIKELVEGYEDNGEQGVVAYSGNLDVRPPYQREFVYNEKQRDAVIDTIERNFPLNTMYWVVNDDGHFEVLDGQQRTLSICQYVNGDFSHKNLSFYNLPPDKQDVILNYKLMIYFCSGEPSERLDWFRVINIAGEKLTEQELRNATYHGPWLSDAKKWFSKSGCPAHAIAEKYMSRSAIRQEYLETAIKWISDNHIEAYMDQHRMDAQASELWNYFANVIKWVKDTFPKYYKEMKSVDWHPLYLQFHDKDLDVPALQTEIAALMKDIEIKSKSGIFPYVLTRDEKYLNLRQFDDVVKRSIYEQQAGICPHCHKHFEIDEMDGDHIVPWSKGGKTEKENCQMLCKECNRRKGNQ